MHLLGEEVSMHHPITLSDEIVRLGPVFAFLFYALLILGMLALLGIGIWGVVKGYPGVRAREPRPGLS